MVQALLAGLLAVTLLLCWVHGVDGDEHALIHAPCVAVMALLAAVVLLPCAGGTGWLLATVTLTVGAASFHLPDPPPKRLARS